jgi:hypothetical protein
MQPTGTECGMAMIMSLCLFTFYVAGEVFKMNGYMSAREMEAILDGKGGVVL